MYIAQSAVAVEYADCFSAGRKDTHPNVCPGYESEQSLVWPSNAGVTVITITPTSILARSDCNSEGHIHIYQLLCSGRV